MCEDIRDFLNVSREDTIQHVQNYNSDVRCIDMKVCAVCAVRDPEITYEEVALQSIPETHWLHLSDVAKQQLVDAEPIQLVSATGETLAVEQCELHHVYKDTNTWMHLVPSAVNRSQRTFFACKRCASAVQRLHKTRCGGATTTLYSDDAPEYSIARGCDYGRIDFIGKTFLQPLSALEMLVLAEARTFCVALKIKHGQHVAHQLQGHVITFPHRAVDEDRKPVPLCKAVLTAAFEKMMILFMAPRGKGPGCKGWKNELCENALLHISSLQLRPHLLFNHLMIRSVLHGYAHPPPIEIVSAMLAEFNVKKYVTTKAHFVEKSDLEEKAEGQADDIAGVRSQESDSNDEDNPSDEKVAAACVNIGVLDMRANELKAVIDSIDEVMHDQPSDSDSTGDDDSDTPRKRLLFDRDEYPLDDYSGGGALLIKAFWPLFILRGVFPENEVVTQRQIRHFMLHYDNRFAQNLQLLFVCADMLLRHRVNSAVGASVKNNPEALQQWSEAVQDENIPKLLSEAKSNPRSRATADLIANVMRFLHIAGRKLDHSSFRRRSCLTEMIAQMRARGPPGQFLSAAPHDVHDLSTLRYATPFKGYSAFPASLANAVASMHRDTRTKTSNSTVSINVGKDEEQVDVSERSLRAIVSDNPIAATLSFNQIIRATLDHLLCAPRLKRSVPYQLRRRGVFGITSAYTLVVESAQRQSLHIHSHTYTGLPQLLGQVAHDANARGAALEALDTHVAAHMPTEYHLLAVVVRHIGEGKRRDSAHDSPSPADKNNFWHHVYMTVSSKNDHSHTSSCVKYRRGVTGCRYAKPSAHCNSGTRCFELHQNEAIDRNTGIDTLRCPYCYCRSGRSVEEEDELRRINFNCGAPRPLQDREQCGVDRRCICVELGRPSILPWTVFSDEIASLIEKAILKGEPITFPETNEGNARLRHVTEVVCRVDSPMRRLLARANLIEALRNLTSQQGKSCPLPVQTVRLQPLRRIFHSWSHPTMLCRNGNVADFNKTLTACLGSNVVPLQLGAGAGATHTACYQSPYMTKQGCLIVGAASLVAQAAKYCEESTASDSATSERK